MVKRVTPWKIVLPNLRKFFARYKRVTRDSLPTNPPIKRTYKKKRGGKRVQRGKVFKIFAKNIFGKIKKFAESGTGKMLLI